MNRISPSDPEDNDIPDEIDIDFPQQTKFDGVYAMLSSFGPEVEILAKKFVDNDINFRNLSLLNNEDLELLGIEDPATRANMIDQFSQLPNQVSGYNKMLAEINVNEYNNMAIRSLINHLNNMNTSLLAAHLKLYLKRVDDIPVGDHIYASSYVIKTLDEMERNALLIKEKLLTLTDVKLANPKMKSSRFLKGLGIMVVVSLSGYLIYRVLNRT